MCSSDLVLTGFAIIESDRHFLQYWLGALVPGLALPLFAQLSAQWIVESSRVVARYSYGIYLSHFICIWFAFVYLAGHSMGFQNAVFLLTFVGMPVVLYHGVEDSLIRVGKNVAKRVVGRKQHLALSPLGNSMASSELPGPLE